LCVFNMDKAMVGLYKSCAMQNAQNNKNPQPQAILL
jgi:hypothetical protein